MRESLKSINDKISTLNSNFELLKKSKHR